MQLGLGAGEWENKKKTAKSVGKPNPNRIRKKGEEKEEVRTGLTIRDTAPIADLEILRRYHIKLHSYPYCRQATRIGENGDLGSHTSP